MATWVVPGFAEERQLGSGASGRVVAAVHVASGTPVAIKYLLPRLLGDPAFLAAFRAEAELLKGLTDRHVVRLYDYIEAPGPAGVDRGSSPGAVPAGVDRGSSPGGIAGAAIVMEMVDGASLHEMITRQGPTTPESALAVLKGSLLGLAAAHAVGVVHRDYKPENVLVDREGTSKLTDFGIATRAGHAASAGGTPLYMAPEQWDGAPATPATDIYAATAVFFECLTGMTPFSGQLGQLAEQHALAAVPVELVAEPVRALIARGMAKDPAARPAHAAAFVAELEGAAAAAYGAGWEERGRGQLAERAAALLLLLLHGSTVAGGTGTASVTTSLAPKAVAAKFAGLSGWQVAGLYVGLFAGVFAIVGGTLVGISLGRGGSSSASHSVSVNSPAPAQLTAHDLLSAPVPASCQHPAGRLVNGVLPGIAANQGDMELAWVTDPRAYPQSSNSAFGHLTGDGTSGAGDAAAVLYCNAGGVSWPGIIAFYGPGPSAAAAPRLLAWAYITAFNLPGISGQENAIFRRISFQQGAIDAEWSTQDNGDPAAASSLDYSATLKLAAGQIVATNLVGVTERQAVLAFAGYLRAGNQAAADRLAAPRVGEQAATLFRSYPSALAATPTCYGLTDTFSMPAPLANLITAGGPGQASQNTERLCAFPSTDPGASWVALGLVRTGWRTWQVRWARSA